MKSAAAIALGLLALLLAVSWCALKWSGVAILETRSADGSLRRTHVWYAEEDGGLWLEAANPERPWLRDLEASSEVALERDGQAQRFQSRVVHDAHAHDMVRARLRQRYGLRDAWVGLFQDTSRSVAVYLVPLAPDTSGTNAR